MADKQGVARCSSQHTYHRQPHIRYILWRISAVTDAEHVRQSLEQRPRVLFWPIGVLHGTTVQLYWRVKKAPYVWSNWRCKLLNKRVPKGKYYNLEAIGPLLLYIIFGWRNGKLSKLQLECRSGAGSGLKINCGTVSGRVRGTKRYNTVFISTRLLSKLIDEKSAATGSVALRSVLIFISQPISQESIHFLDNSSLTVQLLDVWLWRHLRGHFSGTCKSHKEVVSRDGCHVMFNLQEVLRIIEFIITLKCVDSVCGQHCVTTFQQESKVEHLHE